MKRYHLLIFKKKILFSLSLIFFLFSVNSCSSLSSNRKQENKGPYHTTRRSKEPTTSPLNIKNETTQGTKQFSTNASAKQQIDFHFKSGTTFFQNRNYLPAYDSFIKAADLSSGSTKEIESYFWALRSAVRGGQWAASLELQEKLSPYKWPEQNFKELFYYKLNAYENLQENIKALDFLAQGISNPLLKSEQESLKLNLIEKINRSPEEDVLRFLSSVQEESLKGPAYYRLALLSLERKEEDKALSYFERIISTNPGTDFSQKAQEQIYQIESMKKVDPKTIGLILPMSGKFSNIGQKTLRGLQMGLGLYEDRPSPYKLAIIDSEGHPDKARRGVETLVRDYNVISIVGSVLSKTASAVSDKSTELGVPNISLSQKAGITEGTSYVFRNSITNEMQIRHLVKVAMEQYGFKKFAILYPNDIYGIECSNFFWDEVLARGGQITAAQIYSSKETDFRYIIQRLVGTFYLEARAQEYKLRLKEWSAAQSRHSARNNPPEDLLPPIVNFDAIFIPDNVKSLGQIAAMLSYNSVKAVKLLGTNIWNVPDLGKRSGNFLNDILFVDSFISSDENYQNSPFISEYKRVFNEEPGIFEIQAYDTAVLLKQLLNQGNSSREQLSKALSQFKTFNGAIGPMSATRDQEILRPLIALTLEDGFPRPLKKVKNP